jgi:MerR family transcriptional regulator, light-induced transcriptional regulator
MATAFGLSGLRSKLADWRSGRKSNAPLDSDISNVEPIFTSADLTDNDNDLSRVIENLVIPRLIANRAIQSDGIGQSRSYANKGQATVTAYSDAEITEFAQLCLRQDAGAMLDFVDLRLVEGHSVETVYVELLAPAARQLGKYWEDDSQDFIDVTMGLWRIQEILRELSSRAPPVVRNSGHCRSAIFASMPGEQHSLGTLMVAECFERTGWQVEALIEPSQSDLNVKIAEQYFDLIGLTVSCDCTTAALGSLVKTIKAISCNPHIRIMLGGRFINENRDLVDACGADGTAADAKSALALADQLIPMKLARVEHLI